MSNKKNQPKIPEPKNQNLQDQLTQGKIVIVQEGLQDKDAWRPKPINESQKNKS